MRFSVGHPRSFGIVEDGYECLDEFDVLLPCGCCYWDGVATISVLSVFE